MNKYLYIHQVKPDEVLVSEHIYNQMFWSQNT